MTNLFDDPEFRKLVGDGKTPYHKAMTQLEVALGLRTPSRQSDGRGQQRPSSARTTKTQKKLVQFLQQNPRTIALSAHFEKEFTTPNGVNDSTKDRTRQFLRDAYDAEFRPEIKDAREGKLLKYGTDGKPLNPARRVPNFDVLGSPRLRATTHSLRTLIDASASSPPASGLQDPLDYAAAATRRTPLATPQQRRESPYTPSEAEYPRMGALPLPPDATPAVVTAPTAAVTITPSGGVYAEDTSEMTPVSSLTPAAADAVDSSAKATTELHELVQDTVTAVNTLVDAQKKTESASPALSQQVLAQIQADPAIAKLVSDGLLKWDDLLGENPGPGQPGHVSGVEPGDPVVLPDKLQRVIDNLQTTQAREAASLKGAIEANQAARTTTGFRQSAVGYYPQAQVWMPIRAPPASLPGRR